MSTPTIIEQFKAWVKAQDPTVMIDHSSWYKCAIGVWSDISGHKLSDVSNAFHDHYGHDASMLLGNGGYRYLNTYERELVVYIGTFGKFGDWLDTMEKDLVCVA